MTDRPDPRRDAKVRAANVRTALVLAAIALTFFVGAIVSKFMGGYVVGMSVVGFAIFLFLAAAIGRHLASGK